MAKRDTRRFTEQELLNHAKKSNYPCQSPPKSGTELAVKLKSMMIAPDPLAPSTAEPKPISRRARRHLVIAAWVGAALAAMLPISVFSPGAAIFFALYFWAFPAGIINFLPSGSGATAGSEASPIFGLLILGIGWAIYVWLTIYAMKQQARVKYFLVYGFLCLLLAVNAVGCNVNVLKGAHP